MAQHNKYSYCHLTSEYCYTNCPKGKKMKEHLLDTNDSVYDAVEDFKMFLEECNRTCTLKEKRENASTQDTDNSQG